MRHLPFTAVFVVALLAGAEPGRIVSGDQYRLSEVSEVQFSPDGAHIAYSILKRDSPGPPYALPWVMDVATGRSHRLGNEQDRGAGLRWSPDGRWIAFFGSIGNQGGLAVIRADGSDGRVLAPLDGTNHPLPSAGAHLAWSPDSKQIAYVSATPGPESAEANGDPVVIRRYLYKPTASGGATRFDDNKRLHIFVADVASGKVRQLTQGAYYEHSLDWSPAGDEILFVSNHEADPDRFFNYDVFAVKVSDGSIRRLTETKNAEYRPRWSPDGARILYEGTTRSLTSSETTMEDTHVWMMDRDGRSRRDVASMIDNRQGAPEWQADGNAAWFTVQERGSVHLYRLRLDGANPQPETVIGGAGSVGAWSLASNGAVAYGFHSTQDPPQLYVKPPGAAAKRLTNLNAEALAGKTIAPVEAFDFPSYDGLRVQAFLIKPAALDPAKKYPLIVMIHGGPHSQQGPAFQSKSQVYAGHGYATLMVNFRGSTGYGQKFADAIFRDQDGGEAKDVLAGVDAALQKYPWIDRDRLGIEGGSYGGQLTDWLITQTQRFKAAIPAAGISNLISFNYMAYYHDYLAVEFGAFPHQNDLLDVLWQRSALKHVTNVKTPVMFLHGENDNDVPIAEAEQYYIALKDVGVETVMVRYPREGHGFRETKHVVDVMDRSMDWYDRHFEPAK